jgi:hypothetical protein
MTKDEEFLIGAVAGMVVVGGGVTTSAIPHRAARRYCGRLEAEGEIAGAKSTEATLAPSWLRRWWSPGSKSFSWVLVKSFVLVRCPFGGRSTIWLTRFVDRLRSGGAPRHLPVASVTPADPQLLALCAVGDLVLGWSGG